MKRIDKLIRELEAPSTQKRISAIQALGKLGAKAKQALENWGNYTRAVPIHRRLWPLPGP